MLGFLGGASTAEQRRVLHEQAIRYMLFYTEGEGQEMGDRQFWEGDNGEYGARQFDLDHWPEDVQRIRLAGGWRTERELQEVS